MYYIKDKSFFLHDLILFSIFVETTLKLLFEFVPLPISEGFDFPFNIHVIPTTFTVLLLEGCFQPKLAVFLRKYKHFERWATAKGIAVSRATWSEKSRNKQ